MAKYSKKVNVLGKKLGVVVAIGNKKQIRKVLWQWSYKKNCIDHFWKSKYEAITYYEPGHHPIIVLRGKPKTDREIAVIAHEAVHAVDFLMKRMDENKHGDEFYAYAVEAVVAGALRWIKRR